MSDNPEMQTRRRGVEQRAAATKTSNEEAEARMAAGTPTPTQEENDLIKVGALPQDGLAYDGSGPDPNQPPPEGSPPVGGDSVAGTQRRAMAASSSAEYRTRAAAPAPKSE